MKMKISTKFVLIAGIIVLVVSTTMSGVSYYVGRNFLTQRIFAQLNSLAQARAAHVRLFLQHTKESARIIVTSRVIREMLKNLDVNGSDKASIIRDMNQRLDRFLVGSHIDEGLIVGTNGRVIASTNPEYIGLDRSTSVCFTGGQKGLFIEDASVSRTTGKEGLAVSAPMHDYKTGDLLGVIAARVSLEVVNAILNDHTGLGETGEIYLLNKNGFMISQARLAGEDTFLKLKVDTQNSRECFADIAGIKRGELKEKHTHAPIVFRDYRGKKVLGVYAHIPEMDWCLLAEIDVYEAYAPIRRLRAIIFLFGIIFAVLTFVIAWLVVRHVARPVNDLNVGAKRIGSGDLQYRVNIHTGDEIEQLANEFNRMAEKLADSYASLEKKVAERTRHLNDEIAARKKAEDVLFKSEQKFKDLTETTTDWIWEVDKKGVYIYSSPKVKDLLGYEVNEVLGKTPFDFMHEEAKVRVGKYFEEKVKKAELIYNLENKGLHKDGHTVVLETNGIPIFNKHGQLEGYRGIDRDITDRKKIEKIKTEFISTVSHELRTPLTSIQGSLGLIAGGVTGELPEKAGELLNIARRNCDRLIFLINDILDIEKVESGKIGFNMMPLDLMPVVEQAIKANQSYADKYGVEFVLKEILPESKVYADENRLIQVMVNLLSNAAKFSPKNERVVISVTHTDKFIRVAVKDKGSGIPEEFRNRIFQKFAQADSSDTRQKEGTGLGLSISKAIIEKMGGAIGFESQPGKGATFFFEVPEWVEIAVYPEKAEEKPGQDRILICEDDRDIANFLSLLLVRASFTTDIAYNAVQAKAFLAKQRYDAMTLDIKLPDQDGIALLHDIRKNEKTHSLSVIVVSVVPEPNKEELNGSAIGIIDWFTKPIDVECLLQSVKLAVKKNHGQKSRILHVEDDPDVIHVVSYFVKDIADVVGVMTQKEARQKLEQENFDLVILDLKLPDGNGVNLLPLLNKPGRRPLPVLIYSAYEVSQEVTESVAAVLVKSRTSNEELRDTIVSLIQR